MGSALFCRLLNCELLRSNRQVLLSHFGTSEFFRRKLGNQLTLFHNEALFADHLDHVQILLD